MINILELESSTGFGGQEYRTKRLINGLDKSKFKIFYGLNPHSKSLKEEIDCEFVQFNLKRIYNIFEIFKICRFVKKNNIKIISTHSGKDGNIGMIVGKLCGIKVIRTRHLQIPIKSALSYNFSSKVVTVSKATKKILIECGVKENLIEIIYSGIDTSKFTSNFKLDLKNELNLAPNTIIIGIVSILRAAKNHKLLIEAFNELKLKNLALVIVGDGPQKENIQELIKDKKNIFMLGNRTDIGDFIGSFDIFVLPSKTEASGTAVLEASCAGVSAIGSSAGGIPEVIKDGYTGIIFESENKKELKLALKKLILDKDLREEFGNNAKQFVIDNFSVEAMVSKTEDLYERILNDK